MKTLVLAGIAAIVAVAGAFVLLRRKQQLAHQPRTPAKKSKAEKSHTSNRPKKVETKVEKSSSPAPKPTATETPNRRAKVVPPPPFSGRADLRNQITSSWEQLPEESDERQALSNRSCNNNNPENGLVVSFFGQEYFWTIIYNESRVKIDVITQATEEQDIWKPRCIPTISDETLLLPLGAPIKFVLLNNHGGAIFSLDLRDVATEKSLAGDALVVSAGGASSFNASFSALGQEIYSKDLLELEQQVEEKRAQQPDQPQWWKLKDHSTIRRLDPRNPSHDAAVLVSKRLNSTIAMFSKFKIVSTKEFEEWIEEKQEERAI